MAKPKPKQVKDNVWRMLTVVQVEALRKGQYLPVAGTLILLVLIIKTPGTFVPELWRELFGYRNIWGTAGVVFSVLLALGWFKHSRWQRRRFREDYARVVDERNALQAKLLPRLVESSESKKNERAK